MIAVSSARCGRWRSRQLTEALSTPSAYQRTRKSSRWKETSLTTLNGLIQSSRWPTSVQNRVGAVVERQAQRLHHHRVHVVEGDDVGELQDLLIREEALERVEHGVGRAPGLQGQAVGVGQHRPLFRIEAVRHLPVWDGGDL